MQATKQLIVLLLLVWLVKASYSQNNIADTTKPKTDTTKQKEGKLDSAINALSFKIDDLHKIVQQSKNSDKENTGIFFYDTLKKVPVYTFFKDQPKLTARTIVVDKITMLVQDGYIIDVQVFSGKKVFTNYYAPITISGNRFSIYKSDYLNCKNNEDEFIILQEALNYTPLSTFFPEDKLYVLDNKHYIDTVFKNVGVNTILDLRLYTDALAALGDEANGLFQTDVRLKQFIHRTHKWNSGLKAGHYFKINFTASKLDSKNSFVDSTDNLSRSSLYQKSKVNAEIAINIISSWIGRKTLNNYYFDLGAGYNTVNLARSTDTIPINVQSIFLEGGVSLRNSSNIGFEFYSRFAIQFSPQTDFKDQDKGISFLRLGGEVFWNPFDNVASRIFGRINYTLGMSVTEKKNTYSQVQIGYSILLSKAIGGK